MAKRVYKERVYPIASQIAMQRAIVRQCESALADQRQAAAVGVDLYGEPLSEAKLALVREVVPHRERELAEAQAKLAALEAQQASA